MKKLSFEKACELYERDHGDCDHTTCNMQVAYSNGFTMHALDLWLTRNRHGAGFWECDHCDEAQGEALTNASEALGDFELYIGDDGKIYA